MKIFGYTLLSAVVSFVVFHIILSLMNTSTSQDVIISIVVIISLQASFIIGLLLSKKK